MAHVLSHHHGGEETLDNLRPICKSCNRAMGKMHMVEYIKNNVPSHRISTTLKRLKLPTTS
jgi:5-methylcytosine-specific restriction endonuclease McrA